VHMTLKDRFRRAGGGSRVPLRVRWSAADWRIKTLIVAFGMSVVLSVLIYWIWGLPDPATHFGAVFASWVAGVALFAVFGAATTLVSVAQPERESFDARARILFRKQSGAHIDYIVSRIQGLLEHYAESTSRRLIIEEYDAGEAKFRAVTETISTVRSYIDDVPSTYKSKVQIGKATAPPEGSKPNCLRLLRVDGEAVESQKTFNDNLCVDFETTIDPKRSCVVENGFDVWVAAVTEKSTYTPARYTQSSRLEIENRLPRGTTVTIKLIYKDDRVHEIKIEGGEKRVLPDFNDLPPGKLVYTYWLSLA
jgi:hypothetical protein